MAPVPVEVLFGIYLGILTGIIPALVAGVLGFAFEYLTNVTAPGFGVVVLGLAIAGINGGFLALNDPTLRQDASGTVVIVAIVVVLMITLYAHARGDELGATFPHRVSLRGLRERTLSSDVVELVGNRGEVRVEVTGEVEDIEGYPLLPDAIRAGIHDGEWRLPADLPLSELESRFAKRLRGVRPDGGDRRDGRTRPGDGGGRAPDVGALEAGRERPQGRLRPGARAGGIWPAATRSPSSPPRAGSTEPC